MDDDSWTKSIALSVWMKKVQSLPRFKDNASKCHSTKNSLGLFQAREYQRTLEHFGIRNIKKIKQSWSQLWLPNSYLSLFLRNFNEKNSNKKTLNVKQIWKHAPDGNPNLWFAKKMFLFTYQESSGCPHLLTLLT